MSLRTKFLGPKSKYDKSLPYTYTAKVQIIEEDPELVSTYFADTICGLVEYLDKQKISPEEAELFGIYRKDEIKLRYCLCQIYLSSGEMLIFKNVTGL